MRFVDLEKHISIRTKISINNGLLFGAPVAVILFLLTVSSGFFGAILFGLIFGGITFGTIYFIRELTHKGVERKRKKLTLRFPNIDVLFYREIGLLELSEDKLMYHTLTPGGAEKDFEIPLNENQYVSVGLIEQKGVQKLIHKDIELGFILTKEMPNGLPRQFIFYNTDDCLSKLDEQIQAMSTFKFEE